MSDALPLVACDLDRTLVFSAAALGLRMPDAEAPSLVVAEIYEGKPLSFLTARAAELLQQVSSAATFVPTTTRTQSQYSRITLPKVRPRYAVAANGGRILVDGVPDAGWAEHVRQVLADTSAPLPEVQAQLAAVADPLWCRKRRVADELFAYLVVDRAGMPSGVVSELTDWCTARGWTVSVQGRKVYAVPRALTKSAAVAEVAARTGARMTLAAGDSLLDTDLLDAADLGVRPRHGELEETGYAPAHVTVTRERGVLAGEEIVAYLLAAVHDASRTLAASP